MKNFRKLLEIYKDNPVKSFRKLKFSNILKGHDVYNPSGVFEFKGKDYIFARVEERARWASSKVFLFEQIRQGNGFSLWKVSKNFKPLYLEDPFVKQIQGEYVLGGVQVKKSLFSKKIDFKTVFYRGQDVFSLKKFVEGPLNMKDIRLIDLKDNGVGVFTRPVGGEYGRGKIGFTVIESLRYLNKKSIESAELINFPFEDEEWGGVNDAFLLNKGKIGVVAHLAYSGKDLKDKFYYPISFKFDLKSKKVSKIEFLLKRTDLPFDLPKNRFLYNVIFPGGAVLKQDLMHLYVGVGDSKSYEVVVKNPFE